MVKLKHKPTLGVFVIILILLVVFAGIIPQLYASTNGPQTDTLVISQGQSKYVESPLKISVSDVDTSYINITVMDEKSGESADIDFLNEGDSQEITLQNGTINVTHQNYIAYKEVFLLVEYPALYGYESPGRDLVKLVGVFLIICFLYMIYVLAFEGGSQ